MNKVKLLVIAIVAVITTLALGQNKVEASDIGTPIRVIYVQNGGFVKDSNWNKGIIFSVTPYNNTDEFNKAVDIARSHFDKFNVLVTTNSTDYIKSDVWHRTKIIVGSTNMLGQDTGYSFNNSYSWGTDTPGFVLTNNCNPKNMVTDIGHLIAHEAGHIFGLEHELNPTYSYYSVGFIMSNFTGKKVVVWSGNDEAILTPILGLKSDSIPNTLAYNQ
jgi:predicted Zn-dependent protease